MHKNLLIIAINVLLATLASCNLQLPLVDNNFGNKDEKLKAEKQQKYPPCKSCTILVDSFKKVICALINQDSYLIIDDTCRA